VKCLGSAGRGEAVYYRGCRRARAMRLPRLGWSFWREEGSGDYLRGRRGWLSLLIQPGRRADFGTPAQSLVETGHLQRRGVADEHLARKVEAQAAVLQPPLDDAALEYEALATGSPAQLVGAAAASALPAGIARSTVAAAYRRQSTGEAVALVLPRCCLSSARLCGHGVWSDR